MTLDRHGDGQHRNHQHHNTDKMPWCGQTAWGQRHDLGSSWIAFPYDARDFHHP